MDDCTWIDAEAFHVSDQRGSLHAETLRRAVRSPDAAGCGFERMQHLVAIGRRRVTAPVAGCRGEGHAVSPPAVLQVGGWYSEHAARGQDHGALNHIL